MKPKQTKTMGPVEKTLRGGRARILKCGWYQGGPGDEDMGLCAIAALPEDTSQPTWDDTLELLEAAVGVDDDASVVKAPMATWNDTPGRTKGEVLAAFGEAIKVARILGA